MSWPKHLKVDKRIVPLLSKATYENFPRAIRELVSNAYDADATKVSISIRRKSIVIEDNGNGMTPEQFDFYLRIAGRQRGKRLSPKFRRKRIGQFGVGFLAVFPFTLKLDISSTAENSETIFNASIPTTDFMSSDKSVEDVEDIRIMGSEKIEPSQLENHYTIVKLSETSELVDTYLSYKPRDISRISIYSWDGLEKLKWELEEMLPLQYSPKSKFRKILRYSEPIGMEVSFNGKPLLRHDPEGDIVETHTGDYETIGNLKFKYVITVSDGPIHPTEARGLKFRVNNVGVGSRTYFGLNIMGKTYRNLHWLSGEVQIVDGLDDALALNRDQITWNPDYEKLSDFFRKKLSHHAEKLSSVISSAKEIDSVIESKITTPVASKQEIIQKNIDILAKKGYEVKFQASPIRISTKISGQAVTIDPGKKEVIISQSQDSIRDTMVIAGRRRRIVYSDWDYKTDEFPACKFTTDNKSIKINMKYPLFQSKRYGEIFKRIHMLLLIAKEETKNKEQMYKTLINNMLKDFEEIL